MKIQNKRKVKQIAINPSSDVFSQLYYSSIRSFITFNKSYDLNRQARKTSVKSSGDIDDYDCMTGKEKFPHNRRIEKAKFTYSPDDKAFEKQVKRLKDQKEKQIKALKSLEFPNNEIKSIKYVINKTTRGLKLPKTT